MLNAKQEKFCLHFAQTGNATESYKEAGYSVANDATAGANARRLLQRDRIKERLSELRREMASEKIATAAEIQERLTAIIRGELNEEVVMMEGVGNGITSPTKVDKKPSNNDVIKAAQLLARMQGVIDGAPQINVIVPKFGGESELED